MTEANNNANPANFESLSELDSLNSQAEIDGEETTATANKSTRESSNLFLEDYGDEEMSERERTTSQESQSQLDKKMNWQKVAHKLREYNRKLLKKVFRLEQEFEDLEDLYQQAIKKSRSSDVLVVQQETEIRNYREQIEEVDQQISDFQATIKSKETEINNISQQYESAQQQFAQLERQCALLQESCNDRDYEAIAKDRQIKELQSKLERQQRLALQYKAELQRERERTKVVSGIPHKKSTDGKSSHSNHRGIEPWSTTNKEPQISLPKTKTSSRTARKIPASETIKTAAKIATWKASEAQKPPIPNAKEKVETIPKSTTKIKRKSLAAVDLPTFPKQR